MPAHENEGYFPEGFRVSQRPFSPQLNHEYILPLDKTEKDRLAFQHYSFRQNIHGNFSAPVEDALENGIKVIDVGCGTGIWTLEMAEDFPASTFVGTDLANIFPDPKDVPDNCSFVQADTLAGLPYPDNTFDYTFMRLHVLQFTPEDWKKAVAELVRVTKPGGFVELVETDVVVHRAPKGWRKWHEAYLTITRARGRDISIVSNLSILLQPLLVNVESDYISCPLGWHNRIGELSRGSLELFEIGLKPQAAPLMGMTEDEYDDWMVEVSRDMRVQRSWMNGYVAYGRKK